MLRFLEAMEKCLQILNACLVDVGYLESATSLRELLGSDQSEDE
jgi:hypothetical protein